MKIRLLIYLVALFSLFLALLPLSSAQAFSPGITPTPPPPTPPLPPQPIIMPRPISFPEIKYQRVEVRVEGQVALTQVEMLFVNRSSIIQEGTYVFPLPAEATISSLTMWADGQKMVGEILDKDKARQIYENIVRQRRDPALLQYVGSRAVELRVFPIPPGGERKIELEYSLVLKKEAGLIKYIYPLAGTSFPGQTLKELTLNLRISATEPIGNIYSPSHEVSISRRGERQADISYEASNISLLKDFELYYSLEGKEVGLDLLTYKDGEQGYFLLLASPRVDISKVQVVARDVLLVIDVSGSMGGIKLEQAKEALKFILGHLNPEDQFNIISFSSGVDMFSSSLRPVSEKDKALEYVNRLKSAGSTNIHEALLAALRLLSAERPAVVILITDGQPTVGVTDEKQIISAIEKASTGSCRLFTFGIGEDVNANLLDLLAEQNHGISQYVRRNDQVKPVVTAFYEKISTPVLVDITLDFGSVQVEEVYPNPLPDLYQGSQLTIVGRYRQGGEAALSLEGKSYGEKLQVTSQKVNFPDRADDASFLPRLWATRKIGYLLDHVRLKGANKEVTDEIKALSSEYGIMTPYTSYFIQENVPMPMPAPAPLPFTQAVPAPKGAPGAAGAPGVALSPAPTLSAIEQSQQAQRLKQSQTGNVGSGPQVQVIADKTFIYRDGRWTDTKFKDGMPTVEITFGSQEYFQLLQKHPEWSRYFSLGGKLAVVLDDQAYIIIEGSTTQTAPPSSQSQVSPATEPAQGQLNSPSASSVHITASKENTRSQEVISAPAGENEPNLVERLWMRLVRLFTK